MVALQAERGDCRIEPTPHIDFPEIFIIKTPMAVAISQFPITFEITTNPIIYGGGHTFTSQHMNRGVAYEQDGYFVCMYGYATGLRGIAPGISFTQKASGNIAEWVTSVFGAVDVRAMTRAPGECSQLLWRPGLDTCESVIRHLVPDRSVMSEAGVALSLLLSRFDDVAQFIQPDKRNLDVFGHQLRELLILACTEVETSLRGIYASAVPATTQETRLTTNDYFRLCDPLFLREFCLELRHYPSLDKMQPFLNWDGAKPTKSLGWYDAYNAVKHDRTNAINKATLRHCLEALSAACAVYCAQFSIPVGGDWMHEPSFELNDWFKIELIDPDPTGFYVPPVRIPSNQQSELWLFDGRETGLWSPKPLKI